MDVAIFKQKPVLGILRGADSGIIEPLVETVISAGLKSLEITMNTSGAAELIRKARRVSRGRLFLGAGTVLNMSDLKTALNSGATFIVMPVLVDNVVKYCVKNKIPVFPGALSPQEIFRAWEAGATMVKVFPAKFFGPEYFRQIKGPFNRIELLACAGVTAENIKDYFACGADAVTFGASVFKKKWLESGDFKSIGREIKKFLGVFIFAAVFLLTGCAGVPLLKKKAPVNIYQSAGVVSIYFFPKSLAKWDGYELTNKNWNQLTEYQKLMFILEGIRELEREKEVVIMAKDIQRTITALDYGVNKMNKDVPQAEILMINFMYDVFEEAKMAAPRKKKE